MHLDRNSFAAALAHERGYIVISPTEAAIPLMRKDFITGTFALVSPEDAAQVGQFYWSKGRWEYPRRRDKDGKGIQLHREVMGCKHGDGLVVDHINRDRLDARKENLRFVSQAENMQNRRGVNRTSLHRGVSYQSRSKQWVVMHKLKGKNYWGGNYETEEEAIVCARKWRDENMPFSGESSPHRGVAWDKAREKWKAYGRLNYQMVFLGRYDDELEAAEAARLWREKNFTHTND